MEAGDLFEWRQADDCFVRYTVTEVKPDPTGTVPRKLIAVEWMTYACTGCSGTVSENLATGIDFGPLPDLGGTDLISPVRHGIFQVVPEDWTGAIDPGETHELPEGAPPYPGPYAETRDVTVARGFPYWREPQLPTGWRFSYAFTGGLNVSHGYCAFYEDVDGWAAVEICGEALLGPGTWRMSSAGPNTDGTREYLYVREARWFSGRPAAVRYSPEGPLHHRSLSVRVWVHDVATQSIYTVVGVHRTLLGSNVEDVIAIAHSLFEGTSARATATATPTPTPVAPGATTTFRYDTYDTTGAVSTPGSHTILTDSSSTTSAASSKGFLIGAEAIIVTTYDSEGNSHAQFYDSIKVGDVVEWYPTNQPECWQRYKITAILTDPPGDPPRKRFAVESLYVFLDKCPVSTIADIVGQEDVELRWNPPAGRPGCDGIPVMLKDQPVPGGASYRAAPHENLVIDIPHGMTVVRLTGFVAASVQPLRLEDVESGSLLLMNLGTGEEWKRTIVTSEDDSRDVGALFDQIVASARTVVESCSD